MEKFLRQIEIKRQKTRCEQVGWNFLRPDRPGESLREQGAHNKMLSLSVWRRRE